MSKQYPICMACSCPKGYTATCGINYRSGT